MIGFISNENGLIRASTDLKTRNKIMSESGIHVFHYEFRRPHLRFCRISVFNVLRLLCTKAM